MEVLSAKELRIGNLVLTKKDLNKEYVITKLSGAIIDYIECESILSKPIPLTEEWLLKFGFKKDNNLYTKDFCGGLYSLQLNLDYNGTHFTYYDGYVVLDFIHKLQNLYFALTGEELTINQ